MECRRLDVVLALSAAVAVRPAHQSRRAVEGHLANPQIELWPCHSGVERVIGGFLLEPGEGS